MKKKDLTEIKTKTIEDLNKLIPEKEKQKAQTKLEQKLGKIKNVHQVNQIKKDLAQIKTILSRKRIEVKNGTD